MSKKAFRRRPFFRKLFSQKSFFQELELEVLEGIYPPAEDSFLLAECLAKIKSRPEQTALDLGCGSGLQGAVLAKNGFQVLSADKNPLALKNTQLNAKKLGWDKIKTRQSSLFSDVKEKFDLIAFNPPYVPSQEIRFEDLDAGRQGRETIDRFIEGFPSHLKAKGTCFLLQSSLNGLQKTKDLLKGKGFQAEIAGRKKLFFEELFVLKIRKSLG